MRQPPQPNPAPLANLARAMLQQAQQDALRSLARGQQPDLSRWIPAFVQAATPMIVVHVLAGQKQRATELLRAIKGRRFTVRGPRRKALGATPLPGFDNMPIGISFDLFNPMVHEFIRNTTYHFVQSTLETAATESWKTYQAVRAEMGVGLKAGDTAQEMNRRMFAIFNDPAKAARIGATESMRAVNGGAYMLAQQSGVTSATRWIASTDACSRCLALNGQVRKLGKPFYVDPKGGPYATVLHPPLHPHCFCTHTDVLDADIPEAAVRQLAAVAGRV